MQLRVKRGFEQEKKSTEAYRGISKRGASLSSPQVLRGTIWTLIALIAIVCLAGHKVLFDVASETWFPYIAPTARHLEKIRDANTKRGNLFYSAEYYNMRSIAPISNYEPARWVALKDYYSKLSDILDKPDPFYLQTVEFECLSLPQIQKNGKIVSLDEQLGFRYGKVGAMVLNLEDGRKAMFKPCAISREFPEMEVVAQQLDILLGFHRMAPAIIRNITIEELASLMPNSILPSFLDRNKIILDEITSYCKLDNNTISGSITGWWDGLQEVSTFPKKVKHLSSLHEIETMRDEIPEDELIELTQYHLFCYFVNIQRRPGKNEFADSRGNIVLVDLDRANFTVIQSVNPSVCYYCKIDAKTFNLLKEFQANNSLGISMQYALSQPPYSIVFPDSHATTLQTRLEIMMECFADCIEKYGFENVVVS